MLFRSAVHTVAQITGTAPIAIRPYIMMSGNPKSFDAAQTVATIAAPSLQNARSVTPDAARKQPSGLKAWLPRWGWESGLRIS